MCGYCFCVVSHACLVNAACNVREQVPAALCKNKLSLGVYEHKRYRNGSNVELSCRHGSVEEIKFKGKVAMILS